MRLERRKKTGVGDDLTVFETDQMNTVLCVELINLTPVGLPKRFPSKTVYKKSMTKLVDLIKQTPIALRTALGDQQDHFALHEEGVVPSVGP
jgi:hypothetical protein